MTDAAQIEHVHYDSDTPIIDHLQFNMLFKGDDGTLELALATDLVELFQTECGQKLDTLHAACAQDDARALRHIVHFIAGSAGNLGLARLHAFYRAIERAIVAKSLPDLTLCEAPIRKEYETACEALQAELRV
jgi:HPt (histidine-containing phosphotransfer) domain-containing protein